MADVTRTPDMPLDGDVEASETAQETAEETAQAGPQPDDAVRQAEDRAQRALADLENYRRRFDRELGRLREQEREAVLRDLLPVVDNLERALAAPDADTWRAGVQQVHRLLVGVLKRYGAEPVTDEGKPFDPTWHDVVATTPADAEEGTIVQVAERGYRMGDRPLRHARVVVAKD